MLSPADVGSRGRATSGEATESRVLLRLPGGATTPDIAALRGASPSPARRAFGPPTSVIAPAARERSRPPQIQSLAPLRSLARILLFQPSLRTPFAETRIV